MFLDREQRSVQARSRDRARKRKEREAPGSTRCCILFLEPWRPWPSDVMPCSSICAHGPASANALKPPPGRARLRVEHDGPASE
eukprot:213430-Rhodomonas_salina.1